MTNLTPLMNPASPVTSRVTVQATGTALSHTSLPRRNRVLPGEEGEGGGVGDSLNLIFIVGLALVITVLARYFSTRGRRK